MRIYLAYLVFILFFGTINTYSQGICVPELFKVKSISGKVMISWIKENDPVAKAKVGLYKYPQRDTVISTLETDKTGTFLFENLKKGKYLLMVNRQGFLEFDLLIKLTYTKKSDQNEIIIWLAADFIKPCGGSYAEIKKRSD